MPSRCQLWRADQARNAQRKVIASALVVGGGAALLGGAPGEGRNVRLGYLGLKVEVLRVYSDQHGPRVRRATAKSAEEAQAQGEAFGKVLVERDELQGRGLKVSVALLGALVCADNDLQRTSRRSHLTQESGRNGQVAAGTFKRRVKRSPAALLLEKLGLAYEYVACGVRERALPRVATLYDQGIECALAIGAAHQITARAANQSTNRSTSRSAMRRRASAPRRHDHPQSRRGPRRTLTPACAQA